MMADDKNNFSRFLKSICNRQCKQTSKCSWWKSFCFCRSRFSEEFVIENIYEDLSDIEWNEITKTPHKSRGQSTEQVLVMETNMLSTIPECFPSSSDVETSYVNKKRSIFDLKSHDGGDIIARKWSPTENWSFGHTAAWDAQEHETTRDAADKRSGKRSLTRREAFRDKHAFKKNIFCKKGYKTFQNESELEHSYNCFENEPHSKIKFKTKVLTSTKKRKTKLTSKFQGQFRSSLSSTAEYGKIETSFSFASYVKRGNPHFHSSCTQKFTTYDNVSDTSDLDQPLKYNVTFNPIFQEEEARDIDPRRYRLYTIVEEPEE